MSRQIIPPAQKSPAQASPPKRQISAERQGLYYVGTGLTWLGMILFLSVFVTTCMHLGNVSQVAGDVTGHAQSFVGRAVGGFILMIIGGLITNVSSKGIAGSGLKLDPQQAREDLEPWSRMSGGMLKDTLDEAGINLSRPTSGNALPFDEQLRRLEQLKLDGLVTEAEHAILRKRIMDSLGGPG